MEAPVAKDLQIFSPTHPALLEDCVPVRSSRWWQVLIKRGWWRTAAPVDGQWWGRFLSWKGVWWALAPSCIWIQANGINLNCFSSSNIFAFPQKFLTQYLTRRGAWQRAASATPGWRSRPSLEPVAALQPRPERCWDVQDQAVTSSQQVNYLAVEVQDVARRCIAAEPPILIENNYEFPFFPYWIDIQILFNSLAGCLAGGRPPPLMRALSCRGRSHFAPAKSSDQVVMGFIIKNSSAALENCFHIYALFCWFFCHNRRFLQSRSKKCNQNVPNEVGGFLNNVQRNCRLGHGGRP